MKFILTAALITLVCSTKLFATSPTQDFMSPVSTDAAYAFWTGTAMTTYLLISEDTISDVATKNTSERKPLGDASKFGDLYGQVYPNAIYFLGMGIHGMFTGSRLSYGRHFLHDVVAGMTLGASYGLGTYFTQHRGQGKKYAIAPILDYNTTGLRMVASW